MKGSLQKTVIASHLACAVCAHFRDDDPDLFYCILHQDAFPGLCEKFQSKVKSHQFIPSHLTNYFIRSLPGCIPNLFGEDECLL